MPSPKWEKGESGNPKGRPVGSKNKLITDFINALADDFQQYGEAAIRAMREDNPANYIKAVVQLVPKDFRVEHTILDEIKAMSPEERTAKIHELQREQIIAMTEAEFEEHMARLYGYRDGQVDPAPVSYERSGLH